jgi:hypothetical protein
MIPADGHGDDPPSKYNFNKRFDRVPFVGEKKVPILDKNGVPIVDEMN